MYFLSFKYVSELNICAISKNKVKSQIIYKTKKLLLSYKWNKYYNLAISHKFMSVQAELLQLQSDGKFCSNFIV